MKIKLREGLVSVTPPGAGSFAPAPSIQAPVKKQNQKFESSAASPSGGIAAPAGNPPPTSPAPSGGVAPFKLDFSSDQGPRLNLTPGLNASPAPSGGVAAPAGNPPPTSPAPAGGVSRSTSNLVGINKGGFPQPNLAGQPNPNWGEMPSITASGAGSQQPLMTSTGEVNPQALSSQTQTGTPTSTTTTARPGATPAWTPTSTTKPQVGASLSQVATGTATTAQMAMTGLDEPKPEPKPESKPESKPEEKTQPPKPSREDILKLKAAREEKDEAEKELKHARNLRRLGRQAETARAASEVGKAKKERSQYNFESTIRFGRGELKELLSENLLDTLKTYAANAGSVAAIPPQLLPAYSVGLVGHMGASRAASDIWKKHYENMFKGGVNLAGDVAKGLLGKIPGVGKGMEKLSKIASAVPGLGGYLGAGKEGAAQAFGILAKRALFNPTTTDEYQIGDTYQSSIRRAYGSS